MADSLNNCCPDRRLIVMQPAKPIAWRCEQVRGEVILSVQLGETKLTTTIKSLRQHQIKKLVLMNCEASSKLVGRARYHSLACQVQKEHLRAPLAFHQHKGSGTRILPSTDKFTWLADPPAGETRSSPASLSSASSEET